MKRLSRKCLVCGTRVTLRVDERGHYNNGHYFGTFESPVEGMGVHKKVRTMRLGKRHYPVVEWTGEKKKHEYWECNTCYEQASHLGWLEERVEKLYGERCKDYAGGCPCCEAWSLYDSIRTEKQGTKQKKRLY